MKVGIFGCGAYGLALCSVLSNNNCEICMWTKFEEEKNQLEKTRENNKLLPGFYLKEEVNITTSIEETIQDKDLLVLAIPAAFISDLIKEMAPFIKEQPLLIATKGIEQKTGLLMNQILEKYLQTENIAVISGPTFAEDLVKKMPVGLTLASKNLQILSFIKSAFQNDYVKIQTTDDVVGIELCGALKNIFAIISGAFDGLGANDSTKALFLTEAIYSMKEILTFFNATPSTVLTYAGMGDLLLTCNSIKSRNYKFGRLLGNKASSSEVSTYLQETTVEGYYTLSSVYELLKANNKDIPFITLIYKIVTGTLDVEKLFTFLVEKN